MTHLRLFGSYAHGTATDESDIDLLYTYDTWSRKDFSRWPYGQFEHLKERLGKDVDLVSKDYIDDLIKDNVLSSSVSIY
jgi:predicted nucleotidyltransferase